MEDIFELDDDTLGTVENGIDSLIHQLGKDCKLLYEGGISSEDQCPNCIYDPNTKRSSGIYNGFGPIPFSGGKCPVCKGKGYLRESGVSFDIARFLIDWKPKPWEYFDPATLAKLPQGLVSTKGFIADMPKVIEAKYLIVDYANVTLQSNRFIKVGEPVVQGNIVKNKYFLCFWSRYAS